MDRVNDTMDEDEVSFAPAPSPEEARARLAALRGKSLDAPSRLVKEVEAVAVPAAPLVSIELPADKVEALLRLLDSKAERQKPETPLVKAAKVRITTRVDSDVLEAFKATGAGWQTMINDVLRQNMPIAPEASD